jgi:hypothetical protein
MRVARRWEYDSKKESAVPTGALPLATAATAKAPRRAPAVAAREIATARARWAGTRGSRRPGRRRASQNTVTRTAAAADASPKSSRHSPSAAVLPQSRAKRRTPGRRRAPARKIGGTRARAWSAETVHRTGVAATATTANPGDVTRARKKYNATTASTAGTHLAHTSMSRAR